MTELAFAPGERGETRLKHLYQKAPARVLLPRGSDPGTPLAVLANTGGGLVGGDRFDFAVTADDGASVVVTQQAAEKVYRSPHGPSRIAVTMAAGADSWLEWLPQETILFDGAQLSRRTTVDVAAGGRLLAGELLVFGRRARGERFRRGSLEERWEVRRGGRAVWADALCLEGDVGATIAAVPCLGDARAIATVVLVTDDGAARLELLRAWLDGACETGVRSAATAIDDVVVVRWLAEDALRLRTSFARFWIQLRHHIGGLSDTLPRLWWC